MAEQHNRDVDSNLASPLLVEQYVDPVACSQIMGEFQQANAMPRSYQGVVDLSVRNCSYVELPEEYWCWLERFIEEEMQPYFETGISRDLAQPPLIYCYPEGSGFVCHHDMVTETEVHRAQTNNQPVVYGDFTIVLFANAPDEYGGGVLYFPDFGQRFKPSQGSIVVFPATEHYMHGVENVLWGKRITVVGRTFELPGETS